MDVKVDHEQLTKLSKSIRQLRDNSPEYRRKMDEINRKGAAMLVIEAQSRARSSGKQYMARSAVAIKAAEGAIAVRVASSGNVPYAMAAFWGMERHSGWYGRRRYANSTARQFLPWVGNNWEPGGSGGPYAINEAIRAKWDEVLEMWATELTDLLDD